ncbi:tryptophan-rich sensory protein [Paenibacillus sp. 1011MAR3C5]|uniref:tryptophan-rich sensory protein n=1 Tax=Paenibacillus sp. 1011MAR3C5 TaxID=1675787 RepID=UPI000E6C27F1|nr:tryptophan-rich sensory protein [Paenibacillus sp. 1011MAR3C5]RJE83922.1 tryptophan-rich sensory protein [Paenibacillus sp. 1011MAR3C5]
MKRIYAWLNLIGFAGMIVVNFLANKLPIGGQTTGEISAQYPVLVTPAGYAFSIWSIIYMLLFLFVIYGFTKDGRVSGRVAAIGKFFFLSCLFNIGWLLLWHYELLTSSVFMMFALLIALGIVYGKINRTQPARQAERWSVRLPFSIYLGWICVATIVNVAIALSAGGWDGFGLPDTTWAIIMLSAATVVALALGLKFKDIACMLVFVWAFIAIGIKQQAYPEVAYTSYALAGLLVLVALFIVVRMVRGTREVDVV